MRKLISRLQWLNVMRRYLFYIIMSKFFWKKAFHKRYELVGGTWVIKLNPPKEGSFYWMLLNDSGDGDFADNNWFDLPTVGTRDFKRAKKWQKRNPAENFHINNPTEYGDKEEIEVVVDKMYLNGAKVSPFHFAGLKWIQADGNDHWSVNQGETINFKKSFIGKAKVWYKINGVLYFRSSWCKKIFGYWFTVRSGASDTRHDFTIKRQKEN